MPRSTPMLRIRRSDPGTTCRTGRLTMFDNLIRHDPNDGAKTIIPDLAHIWEIAPDGQTYTFYLRQGVQFHDGAVLTSEDVKATYDRIAKPPTGISIPRSVLFKAVSEINARDKYTVEFKLSEPRPISFMMSAFASGWNVIVRKKTLEDNNYNLRKLMTYPGTGPFRSVRRVENELWVMERNPNYWNNGLPYLDGIEFYHVLPFSPEWVRQFSLGGSPMYVSRIRLRCAKPTGVARTAGLGRGRYVRSRSRRSAAAGAVSRAVGLTGGSAGCAPRRRAHLGDRLHQPEPDRRARRGACGPRHYAASRERGHSGLARSRCGGRPAA